MRITEMSKHDHIEASTYLDHALKLARHWESVWDYFFDHEDELHGTWGYKEEEKIFNELNKIGYEFYLGPKGTGIIDLKKNLLYQISDTPQKPISGIRSDF